MLAKPFFDYKFMAYAPGSVAFLARSLGMHPPDMDGWDHETHRRFGTAGTLTLEDDGLVPDVWWVSAFSHAHDGEDDREAEELCQLVRECMPLVSSEWEEVQGLWRS